MDQQFNFEKDNGKALEVICGTARNYETLSLYFNQIEMMDACDNIDRDVKRKVKFYQERI